jgi:sugar O-acyltransferase (sialic acid O-acetyltransferase NeuD family)
LKILIIGAGGHARVIGDIIRLQGHSVAGYLDDEPSLIGQQIHGAPVLGRIDTYQSYTYDKIVLGIGSNQIRFALRTGHLKDISDDLWHKAIHPTVIIGDFTSIGVGTVIMAGVVINPGTEIGQHTIINTGAIVDHDCIISDYAHVAPAVNLAGGVKVGTGTLLGIGVSVIPYQSIGSWSIIGAGAVVISDLPSNITAVGVPAKVINQRDEDWHATKSS